MILIPQLLLNSQYRGPRNLSLTEINSQRKTRNIENRVQNVAETFKSNMHSSNKSHTKNPFGTSIINKCKSKELSMYIEKASRMVHQLSARREASSNRESLERVKSHSIDA